MLCNAILIEDSLKQNRCDLSKEVTLLGLVGEQGVLVDDHSDEQEAMLAELLLSALEEGSPVFLEAGYPLLTEGGLHELRGGQEEHVV